MSDMQTMRDMLQEAMALIETVVTTRYDPRKVADLNRRAYALMSQQNEPAPAQDDLLDGITWQADPYEANVYRMLRGNNWVAHIRMNGEMLIERHAAMLNAMLAAQPAQTEQQPLAWLIDWPEEPELGHYFSDEPNEHARSRPLYAAPIAQTAPQPEQSGLVLMPQEATPEIVAAMKRELDKAPTWYCRYSAAYRAALSAQGGEA